MLKHIPHAAVPEQTAHILENFATLLKIGRWAFFFFFYHFQVHLRARRVLTGSQWAVRSKPQSYTCVFHRDVALETGAGENVPPNLPPKGITLQHIYSRCFGTMSPRYSFSQVPRSDPTFWAGLGPGLAQGNLPRVAAHVHR